jgi:hypothetical protein
MFFDAVVNSIFHFSTFFVCVVIESWALCILSKCSATELHLQPHFSNLTSQVARTSGTSNLYTFFLCASMQSRILD